jgi:hypothetical protein
MLGRIEKLWDNKTDKSKPYQVLAIGDHRYSFWDTKQFGKFREGDTVEFDWKQAGEYKNITTIEISEADNNGYNGSNGKDERMAKMSCLKSASRILGPMDIDPNKKIKATVSVAQYFERYINNELDDEPSSNSRPKTKPRDEDRNNGYKDIDFGL